jgi:DNA-binding transcriptional LysR family regulator
VTVLGVSALRLASDILIKVRELENAMHTGASGQVPLLRIGMLDSFTSTAGAPMLDRLKDVATEWTVTSGFRATSMQALVERRQDAIVTSEDRSPPKGVTAIPVLREDFMLALPAKFPGDAGSIQSVSDRLPFVRYGRDSHMGEVIEGYLGRAGVHPNARYQFDTTDAALRMVAFGFGWTIVTPLIFLKSNPPAKSVRLVPLPGKTVRRTIVVAMRENEADAILHRMHAAALEVLRTDVMPRIATVLPGSGDHCKVLEEPPGRRAPLRRRHPGD